MRLKNGRVTRKGSDEEGGRLFWAPVTCCAVDLALDEKGKALVLHGRGEMQAGGSRFYSDCSALP